MGWLHDHEIEQMIFQQYKPERDNLILNRLKYIRLKQSSFIGIPYISVHQILKVTDTSHLGNIATVHVKALVFSVYKKALLRARGVMRAPFLVLSLAIS